MLAPGAIIDPEDLRIPGEQPGTPIVVLEDLGEVPHGQRFRARQGKSLLLLTTLVPDVTMQRELHDLLSYRVVQAGDVSHPNLLPTYGCVRLPLGEEGFETLFIVRPDPGCPTLRQWLHEVWQAGHTLDPLNAVAITVQICEALALLHEKFPHGYVTADNVFMYPTGGMPQALLSGTGEGSLLPFAPGFDRFAEAGYLPQAGPEMSAPPHEPRVETDVLGCAALVLEILTGQPLEPDMLLDRFGLPPKLQRILEVASRPDPEDRPQDILMFSRRLQAAVGLGEDPTEPSAVLEPVHHGDHADPRYPAVRAHAWRPPPPAPPPWAAEDAGPNHGSGAWNVGAPTPGSGAWHHQSLQGAPGQGGSGAWSHPAPPSAPAPIPPPIPPSIPRQSSASWQAAGQAVGQPVGQPSPAPPPVAPPAFGRNFPMPAPPPPQGVSPSTAEAMALPSYDNGRSARADDRAQSFGASAPPAAPPPTPVIVAPGPHQSSIFKKSHSVSIMMPAPDGSMMAPLSRGPADFVILRHGKRHGPYDLAQLERLIPMGKLRSVDSIEVQSSGGQALAVDLPGLRPLFEARARAEEASAPRVAAISPVVLAEPESRRGALWTVIGLLAVGLVAAAVLLALR
ncbi:hypothetical protein [Enhygromyxa salina]|uniref:Protein kinase domain-containing protein n=1 Tax=Enhygromyxa salina TaxID=215803 RepID=A0A2S9XZ20_9BACT|nr:hypothetical protein [Enhygromyxa salina]PRP98107.1 hypothetical protein ENSA7_66040 [Enhygromyxa salina]